MTDAKGARVPVRFSLAQVWVRCISYFVLGVAFGVMAMVVRFGW